MFRFYAFNGNKINGFILANGFASTTPDAFIGIVDMKAPISGSPRSFFQGFHRGIGFIQGPFPNGKGLY